MHVLMVNGSPNAKGCTFTALTEIGKTLQEQNINYEIICSLVNNRLEIVSTAISAMAKDAFLMTTL